MKKTIGFRHTWWGIILMCLWLPGCGGGAIAKVGNIQGPDTVGEYGLAIYSIPYSGSDVDWEWFVNPPEGGNISYIQGGSGGVIEIPGGGGILVDDYSPTHKIHFSAGGVEEDTVVELGVVVTSDQYSPVIKTKKITILERGLSTWNRSWGGEGPEGGHAVAADDYGNSYVAGIFRSDVDFDPGEGIDIHSSNGGGDIFLCKYNKNGEFQWAKTWGGIHHERICGIALDSRGDVYVTGAFGDTVDFDPGPGVDEQTSNGEYMDDGFLSKFDSDGQFQWVCILGGNGSDRGQSVAVAGNGNVYVTGYFSETVDFDPGPGEVILESNGDEDVFLSMFNPDGELQWVQTWGGELGEEGWGVVADEVGNVYVTGFFAGSVDFNTGTDTDIHNAEFTDVFLSAFDKYGNFFWAHTWGGEWMDYGEAVALEGNTFVYVTGRFEDKVDFNTSTASDIHYSNGGTDVFISKFSMNGSFYWAQTWGGSDDDFVYDIVVDEGDNVYTTGCFEGMVDFNPGPGLADEYSNYGSDAYVSQFTWRGDFQRVYTIGNNDYTAMGIGLAVDGYGNIFCSGFFGGTVDLNPAMGVDEHVSNGASDAFICKLPPAPFHWILQ